jgi:tetratricopeptide (TPR) repeat protein
MLFLNIDKVNLKKIFDLDLKEKVYLPVGADKIIDRVKSEENMDKIPAGLFIEGMFYVMGADKYFKYNDIYVSILEKIPKASDFIKGKIAKNVGVKNYEDAYILLKGLVLIDSDREVYDKLIIMSDYLRKLDSDYKAEELEIIENAEKFEDYALPYFYHAVISREDEDYEKSLFYINNYIQRGGEQTPEVVDFKQSVKSVVEYDRGKEILDSNPKKSLEILIPLLDVFGDHPSIYYYIAVAYRMLENYEKAIYYLNDALNIDSSVVEVVNEMGINYASIGDYKTAVAYLRKAFDATKSVEICTNLIMCYFNMGDTENAKIHFQIAQKLDPKDEVVLQLQDMFK